MIGKIYRIIHKWLNLDPYIGGTLSSLKRRMSSHIGSFKKWIENEKKSNKISIYPLFEQYGFENFSIVLIKEYEVVDETHLHAYEQLWINKLDCCNLNNPFKIEYLSQKKYREDHKEEIKEKKRIYQIENKERLNAISRQYYVDHKEEQIQKKKEYYEKNKVQISLKNKEYVEQHKEKTAEYQRQYHSDNRARQNELRKQKVICDFCDQEYSKSYISNHKKRCLKRPM